MKVAVAAGENYQRLAVAVVVVTTASASAANYYLEVVVVVVVVVGAIRDDPVGACSSQPSCS